MAIAELRPGYSSTQPVVESYEEPTTRPPVEFARYGKLTPIPIKDLAARYGISMDYFINSLGPERCLYEAYGQNTRVAEDLALELVERTHQRPDIILAGTSHLPQLDRENGNAQRVAWRTRQALAEKNLADFPDKNQPDQTRTYSAACSTFVLMLDRLRQLDPQGKNVLLILDETRYRRTIHQEPAMDSGKAGCLLSDSGIVTQFVYGKKYDGIEVVDSGFFFLPEAEKEREDKGIPHLLEMKVPDIDPDDPFIEAYLPPQGEFFAMDGPGLRKFFARCIKQEYLSGQITQAGLSEQDIKFFLVHQASIRMVQAYNSWFPNAYTSEGIRIYGNTSSTSTVLALEDGIANGNIKHGDIGLTLAFGAGPTWAYAILQV